MKQKGLNIRRVKFFLLDNLVALLSSVQQTITTTTTLDMKKQHYSNTNIQSKRLNISNCTKPSSY